MKPFIYYSNFSLHALIRLLCAALCSLCVLTGSAYADASCAVSSTGVSFGAYDVFNSGDNDTTGNISVACTGLTESSTVAYDILISTGSGSYASRTMTSGSHPLSYNLYTNNSRSIVWGDGSAGTAKISDGYGLGLSAVIKDYSIYGRIPARQNAYVGSYNDTITVTVNYL